MAGNITYEQRKEKINNLIIEFIKKIDNFNKTTPKEHYNNIVKKCDLIIESAADEYYEYPTKYKRKHSLYEAFKVEKNEHDFSFDIVANISGISAKHGHKATYLSEYMFGYDPTNPEEPSGDIGGWHGGDIAGAGHPDPGKPWLRRGVGNKFKKGSKYWLRQASRTKSPYLIIQELLDSEIELENEIWQEEWTELSKKYLDKINNEINKL